MKTIVTIVISITHLIAALSVFQHTSLDVFALSAYQSGFDHGVIDGKDSCSHQDGCHWYVAEPGKRFAFHTWDFVRGYVTGFCKTSPGTSSDADEAS